MLRLRTGENTRQIQEAFESWRKDQRPGSHGGRRCDFLQRHLICGCDSGLRVERLGCQRPVGERSRGAAAYPITPAAPPGCQDV